MWHVNYILNNSCSKIGNNANIKISLSPLFFLFFPSSSISLSSILSPFHLHSVFLPVPFFHMCSIISLSPHSTFCSFQFLFSLSSFPHLNLTIISSFALSLPRHSGISSVIHVSYSLWSLDSLIPSSLVLQRLLLPQCPAAYQSSLR
jgi:hypothetical protein